MICTILLIRHGKTKGNIEKRYIGSKTNEALCPDGIDEIIKAKDKYNYLSANGRILSGPMERCTGTAKLLFGSEKIEINEGLTEMDFGIFENLNFTELKDSKEYREWVDSNCEGKIPEGEKLSDFIDRSYDAFNIILKTIKDKESVTIVCHGGNIMSIMSKLTKGNYFDYHINPLCGYHIDLLVEEGKVDAISYNRITPWSDT